MTRSTNKCSRERGELMANNRVLAAAFGVLIVGWFMLRHTLGFYTGVPAFIIWDDFFTYLLVLIFTPAVMWKARWTALGAVVVGVISIIMRAYGIFLAISIDISKTYGPAVALVLSLLFTYFSFQAYQQK
jgi:hypothetical protein